MVSLNQVRISLYSFSRKNQNYNFHTSYAQSFENCESLGRGGDRVSCGDRDDDGGHWYIDRQVILNSNDDHHGGDDNTSHSGHDDHQDFGISESNYPHDSNENVENTLVLIHVENDVDQLFFDHFSPYHCNNFSDPCGNFYLQDNDFYLLDNVISSQWSLSSQISCHDVSIDTCTFHIGAY